MVVRMAGLEPALPDGKQILSLLRLPFRHIRTLYRVFQAGKALPRLLRKRLISRRGQDLFAHLTLISSL